MNIFLAGFPSEATADDLRNLLSRYVKLETLELIAGDLPEQTVAVLTIDATNAEAHWVSRRLTGLYWRGHTLRAYVGLF
ncbi:hypothetical protein [Amphritea japonica]|uniref:RNA-binding protein n=1 Tax=Amphritea japonica ATCC BAA-1530 TaxID=1278309 RepID=A0A7R6P9Q5_9GAMM|nr:hypothetical protein [Amphritea japonica]BBB26002.1 hypothetical protein AMJAP_1407 [Amphritea japonica ATCC BAA-1530]